MLPASWARQSKMRCAPSLARIQLDQSVSVSIVGELNSIANSNLVKDSVELDFHRSLGDREPFGNLCVVQPFGYISNDRRFAGGERICRGVARTIHIFGMRGRRRRNEST